MFFNPPLDVTVWLKEPNCDLQLWKTPDRFDQGLVTWRTHYRFTLHLQKCVSVKTAVLKFRWETLRDRLVRREDEVRPEVSTCQWVYSLNQHMYLSLFSSTGTDWNEEVMVSQSLTHIPAVPLWTSGVIISWCLILDLFLIAFSV